MIDLNETYVGIFGGGFAVIILAVIGIVIAEFRGIRDPRRGDTLTDIYHWAKRWRGTAWVVAILIMQIVGFVVIGGFWLFGHWTLEAW